MKLIAIETSTECCSVALGEHAECIHHWSAVIPRAHGEQLLKHIDALLAQAGWQRNALDGIVCGIGPGAFTGVRLGVSVAQAMAFALDCPIFPVTSLQALAAAGCERYRGRAAAIRVALDARMGEVYWQAFACENRQALTEPGLSAPEKVCWPDVAPCADMGHGWQTYPQIGGCTTTLEHCDAVLYPQAKYALQWVIAAEDIDSVTAEGVAPLYLRNKVALTESERKNRSAVNERDV